MRSFIFILVGVLFFSCKEDVDSSREQSFEKILFKGEWRLVSSDQPFDRFQNGLKFSEDMQVFNIDSQGRLVASTHERIFGVSSDTLSIIDYKYEESFLFNKGTDVLIIEELTNDKMVLDVLHPGESNRLVFENLK